MKQILSSILPVFCLFLLFPLPSENMMINGTRGYPLLWPCQWTEGQFLPNESYIYWQSKNNAKLLAHFYSQGKEALDGQTMSFRNRTKIFPDHLPSGNLSLMFQPLKHIDDNISLEVIFLPRGLLGPTERLCQVTLYVAAPFQQPQIEIDQKEMTATCNTTGGYPKPHVIWEITDHMEIERTLEPHEFSTAVTRDEDNSTYSVSSTAKIAGSHKVTCKFYNPTSNQILTADKTIFHMDHSVALAVFAVAAVIAIVIIVHIVLYFKCRSQWLTHPSNSAVNGESVVENGADCQGTIFLEMRSTGRSDAAVTNLIYPIQEHE